MFELHERPESESPKINETDESVELTVAYLFRGTNNWSDLRTYILELTPLTINFKGRTLGRQGWQPRFQPGEWGYVDVTYSSKVSEARAIQSEGPPGSSPPTPAPNTPSDTDTLDANWSLSTRGGTVHVAVSKEVISSVAAGGGGAPAFGNFLGASPTGVRGVDVPSIKITASITFPTDLKLPLLRELVRIDEPHTNSQPWLGMAAGEWLYVGCDAQGGSSGAGSVTIHLEGGKNLAAGDPRLVINPSITLPAKKAHEYVDFHYRTVEIDDFVVQEAAAAYVHRMFDEMSFSAVFGFG